MSDDDIDDDDAQMISDLDAISLLITVFSLLVLRCDIIDCLERNSRSSCIVCSLSIGSIMLGGI